MKFWQHEDTGRRTILPDDETPGPRWFTVPDCKHANVKMSGLVGDVDGVVFGYCVDCGQTVGKVVPK
jgi:hypothetical protein